MEQVVLIKESMLGPTYVQTPAGKYAMVEYHTYDLNWKKLYFGHVPVVDVRKHTPQPGWQEIRIFMKGKSLEVKYGTLCRWLLLNDFSYASRIQVTNYVTALSRGGLIKPEDYQTKGDTA